MGDDGLAPAGTVPRRRVLVTGASGGIGRAVAVAFAALGDRVAVHFASDEDGARATIGSLEDDGHQAFRANIGDADEAAGLVDDVCGAFGGIDVLVNNAAASVPAHPVATTPYPVWQDAWRDTLAVNLVGPANLVHQVARRMIEAGTGGRIVNVGSRGAYRGEPENPAYGAAKAGLHALGQSMAVALAPHGIAVTSVAPGFVDTARIAEKLSGPAGQTLRAQSPFDRVADPAEVAAAVVFLASRDAVWASGAVLDLNGASYLR